MNERRVAEQAATVSPAGNRPQIMMCVIKLDWGSGSLKHKTLQNQILSLEMALKRLKTNLKILNCFKNPKFSFSCKIFLICTRI